MGKHHDEWQDQPLAQNLAEPVAGLVLRAHDDVLADALHGLPDVLCFLCQDGRSECLAEEYECGDLDDHSKDRCCPEDPAPTDALRDVGSTDGSYAGAYPGKHTIYCLTFTALFFAPGVGQNPVAQLDIGQSHPNGKGDNDSYCLRCCTTNAS
jgi:hypothetical protein